MKLSNPFNPNSGKKKKGRKIFLTALIVSLLLFLASTHFAHAGGLGSMLFDIGAYTIGKIAFFFAFIIAWIGGIGVGIAAWLITVMIGINSGVFQTVLVQAGFGVTLAIANLGFVLGIIVIAVATILRNQTYGMKQLLWKLVAAAILVNFSLVIMAPVFGFSNTITQYFLNCINGGCNSTGANNASNFATILAGAFNPQAGFSLNPNSQTIANANYTGALSATGGSLGALLTPLMSIGFVAIESIMVVIVLISFVIMLFMRYIYIAILAILMPFAWLCWVFPSLNSHWKKWWAEFIRWTLFAPICIFFLYLAIMTQAAMSSASTIPSQQFATYANSGNAIFGSLATLFGSFFTPIIQNLLNMLVMLGLSVAGLIVANSMGIKGADIGMKAVGSVKDGVTGYVSKRTKSGARNVGDRFRAQGKQYNPATRETTTRLQRLGSRLQNVPGLKGVGVGIANVAAPEAIKKGREKDVQDYVDNNLKSLTNDGVIARATSKTAFVNPTQSAALAQELAKRNLTTHPDVAPLMDKYVDAADRVGNLDKITSNRPDLMPQRKDKSGAVVETKEEAIARAVRGARGDIIQANSESFNRQSAIAGTNRSGMNQAQVENAILSLSPAQLSALGSDTTAGSQDRQNNITDAIKALIAPHISAKNAQGKFELNSAALMGSGVATPEQLKNLEKMVKHMESSNVWGSVLGN